MIIARGLVRMLLCVVTLPAFAADTVPEKIPEGMMNWSLVTSDPTPAPLMTISAGSRPSITLTCEHGYVIFKPDGTVRYRNCKPSEAAKRFWTAIGVAYPTVTKCDKENPK